MPAADPARTRRNDIKAIRTVRLTCCLSPHQYWCETKKAFEIWQVINGLDHMIKRIPRKSVVFVYTK